MNKIRNATFAKIIRVIAITVTAHLLLLPSSPVKSGNDFNQTSWQLDGATSQAGLYYTYIAPTGPAVSSQYSGGYFTTAWLSVDLDVLNPGVVYSAAFSQVGVLSNPDIGDYFWFVYAEPGVTCFQGFAALPDADGVVRGCNGLPRQIVVPGQFSAYSLTRDGGNARWLAAASDPNGNGAYLAAINRASDVIYDVNATSEAGFPGNNDPFLNMSYYFYHFYSFYGDWPSNQNNVFYSVGNASSYPPPPSCLYGGIPNLYGDSRFWYTGDGAFTCGFAFNP